MSVVWGFEGYLRALVARMGLFAEILLCLVDVGLIAKDGIGKYQRETVCFIFLRFVTHCENAVKMALPLHGHDDVVEAFKSYRDSEKAGLLQHRCQKTKKWLLTRRSLIMGAATIERIFRKSFRLIRRGVFYWLICTVILLGLRAIFPRGADPEVTRKVLLMHPSCLIYSFHRWCALFHPIVSHIN
jgi:hypothetical protein